MVAWALEQMAQMRRHWWAAALAAVLVLGGVNFVGGVGAASLFVDEAFSWIVASHPLADLYSQVKLSEVAPPGYYLLLHIWLQIGGSMTETWMRIPSVIAGIGLVAAVAWLCQLLGGRRAAVTGALLTAISPLVLTYAQQVRAYVFVMLATTVAVALALEASRRSRHRPAWLTASGCCGVAAIWLHYTCLSVVIALAVWVLTRPEFSGRAKTIYVAALAVAQGVVTPLLIHQASTGNPGADAFSHLNVTNAFAVLGNPVDGQYASHLPATIIAAAAIGLAGALLLARDPRNPMNWLVIGAAFLPVIALFAITIIAKPVLITRYCTVTTPFGIAILSVAFARSPRLGLAPVLAVAVFAVIGSVTVHEPASRWPPIGPAYRTAGANWQPTDHFVLNNGSDPILASAPLVIYYTERYLPPGTVPIVEANTPLLPELLRQRERIWLVGPPYPLKLSDQLLKPSGYQVALIRRYAGDEDIQLTLVDPR